MRLLVFGHYSHTGFGTVTVELATRFLAAGVDVRILAVNHRGEPVRGPLQGRVWPAQMMGEAFGGNISAQAITGQLWRDLDGEDWKPDAVLAIADVSGFLDHMGPGTEQRLAAWKSLPVFHYVPIEGDNLNPLWRGLWNDIAQPVAMSDYGQRVISEHIGRQVPRIYHGVDTDMFRQVSFAEPAITGGKRLTSRDQCKEFFGLAGKKVLLRADRNATRKFYYRLVQAFAEIAPRDPDVVLVLHCQPNEPGGIDITGETARLPIEIQRRVLFTGMHDTWRGLDHEGLVALYNAADIYVSTTGGEGFGLTLAESLACETPVVVTDWAAEREVVGPGGVLVPPLTDKYGEPVRFHSSYGMDWAIPDAKGFVQPVLDLLAKPSRRRALGQEGRRHVQRSFNWDAATEAFLLLLEAANAPAAVAV